VWVSFRVELIIMGFRGYLHLFDSSDGQTLNLIKSGWTNG
ncbi:21746_t:CDS:1, partial [Dentiscutata erythropus]